MALYYVVSYPKSGATWFRLLMYALFNQQIENSNAVQQFYPEYPTQNDLIDKNIEEGNTSFVKSHVAYSANLPYVENASAIIYISRNPFNCMLSKLDHYKYEGVNWVNNEKGKAKFCEEFIKESNQGPDVTPDKLHGGWNHHILSWFDAGLKIPVINIRYEDLTNDAVIVLEDMVEKLKLDFSKEQIKNAVKLCSFEKIRALEEHELTYEVPGMFYSPKRRKNFMANKNLRFVKMGKKRDAMLDLPTEIILKGKMAFYEGMQLAGYR